ncbi:MAG: hypothetical protein WBA61_01265 [Aequorivita sp.]
MTQGSTSEIYNCSLLSSERVFYNKRTKQLGNSLVEVYADNRLSIESLKWYLEMGYVPGVKTIFEDIEIIRNCKEAFIKEGKLFTDKRLYLEDLIDSSIHRGKNLEELTEEGGELFNQVVDALYQKERKQVILPLTAGLDSRMILGGLLNSLPASEIITYTYGVPGSPDFEISKKISKKFGIKHYAFDTTKYILTKERLLNFAKMSDCSMPLFDHWPIEWVEELCGEYNGSIWSGVLGSPLSGGNLPKSLGEDEFNAFIYRTNRLPSITSLSAALLKEKPYLTHSNSILGELKEITHDTLDIYFRHSDLIAPTLLIPSLSNIQPFGHPDVIAFFLSLPINLRVNRVLMNEIIIKHYPELAKFKSNRAGGKSLLVKKHSERIGSRIKRKFFKSKSYYSGGKYLPLSWYVKNNSELKDLVFSRLQNLESRGLFDGLKLNIIIDEFKRDNLKKVNHDRIIDALVSLEIFLELVDYKR